MRKTIITNKIFEGYNLYLLQGTREECDKYISKYIGEVETEDEYDAMHYYIPRKSFICIYTTPEIGTVLHELNHFIQRMLSILRIPEGIENTELVSNLWSYYGKEVLKFYKLTK